MGAVYGHPRHVACGEFHGHAFDLKIGIDGQAAEPIATDRKARRQRISPHPGTPNHGGCRDFFAGSKYRTFRVDGGDRNMVMRSTAIDLAPRRITCVLEFCPRRTRLPRLGEILKAVVLGRRGTRRR
jgi:hypothetical protein